ncbi:potassium-transporting ATPase subunit F [Odoribacter laneus]
MFGYLMYVLIRPEEF